MANKTQTHKDKTNQLKANKIANVSTPFWVIS